MGALAEAYFISKTTEICTSCKKIVYCIYKISTLERPDRKATKPVPKKNKARKCHWSPTFL